MTRMTELLELWSFCGSLGEPKMLERVQKGKAASAFGGVGRGPTGVIKSVLDTSRADGKGRDEIFVDIVEKISCTFSASGYVQTSQIDGAIQARLHGAAPLSNMGMSMHKC